MPPRTLLSLAIACSLTAGPTLLPRSAAAHAQERQRDDDRLRRAARGLAALDAQDLDGRRWTAKSFQGRVVVLDFWATWCAPCLTEIPWLRRARERFGPDRLEILGVNLDVTDRRTLRAWLNRNRIDWPQVWDDRGYDGRVASEFGVVALPTSILIDAQGIVVAVNLRGEHLLSAIERLVTRGHNTAAAFERLDAFPSSVRSSVSTTGTPLRSERKHRRTRRVLSSCESSAALLVGRGARRSSGSS
jgi:thiol-disulfide isomerase/thioredoxin